MQLNPCKAKVGCVSFVSKLVAITLYNYHGILFILILDLLKISSL